MQSHILNVIRFTHHINHLKQIHALTVTQFNSLSPYFVKRLLTLSHLGYARKVFDEMPHRDEFLYNTFISTYSKLCCYNEALTMFSLMHSNDTHITCYTVPPVLKSCSSLVLVGLGKQVHSLIITCGVGSNRFVQTALMDLYAKSGDLDSARAVFDGILEKDPIAYNCMISGYSKSGDALAARSLFEEMHERSIVSWNSMISCYAQNGNPCEAVRMFERMQAEKFVPNDFTLAIVFSLCASMGNLEMGLKLKKYVDDNNMFSNMIVATAMMEMFVKCGAILEARQVFDQVHEKDVVTWATMIAGYVHNGRPTEALELFQHMTYDKIKPNDVTLVSVLSACTQLGSVEAGEQIGNYIENEGFDSNIYVASALLTMYSRCGNLKSACKIFNRMRVKDVVSWNAMISGLAFNGYAIEAINTYEMMKKANMKPDDATFVALLTACTHAGLVDLGLEFFHRMHSDHGIIPQVDHYACIIDLLCRYGRLNEAYEIISLMQNPNVVIWGTLLSACRTHSNTELAEISLKKLMELEPDNPGNYVLLSNIYANTGRWQDASGVRKLMMSKSVQKTAAFSWIELEDGIHKFLVTDMSHPKRSEIYEVVDSLTMVTLNETEIL